MTNDRQRRRLVIFLGFLGLVVLLLIARLAQLTPAPRGSSRKRAAPPAVERGPILDRNGRVLAITTRLYSVTAWLPEVSDREGSAALLAEALELDPAEIARRFREASGFLFVKRKITPTQSERVRALQAEGRLKGIALVPEFGRNYPNQTLASHVLGYVGLDNVGLDGVEYTFNEELSPAAVSRADAPQAGEVFGNQVFLTIDADIQHVAERHAREALAANQADSVLVLVMEAGSGEILGYAAVPARPRTSSTASSAPPCATCRWPRPSSRAPCSKTSPSPPSCIWEGSPRKTSSSAPGCTRRSSPTGTPSASGTWLRTAG